MLLLSEEIIFVIKDRDINMNWHMELLGVTFLQLE